tara:strand:+ start:98 stop:457 length:360 start_codon:yes stop_codon:yes gene_type:complete
MIVNAGKDEIAVSYVAVNYRTIKVGTGGDDTAASQTNLDAAITQANGSVLTKTVIPSAIGSQLTWTVSFTGSELGTQGIAELGIFHSTSDKLLSRVTFANTGVVPSTDTVTFQITLEVN